MKNREIKFRVWDKEYKEFSNWTNRDPHFSVNTSQIFFWERVRRDDGSYDGDIILEDTNKRFVLQQFTGVKDRNGKDIFEGDIVNVNGGNHIIEWRGAGFAATWSDYNLDTCWFVGGGPVVVGNIFENPELAERARKGPKV